MIRVFSGIRHFGIRLSEVKGGRMGRRVLVGGDVYILRGWLCI